MSDRSELMLLLLEEIKRNVVENRSDIKKIRADHNAVVLQLNTDMSALKVRVGVYGVVATAFSSAAAVFAMFVNKT